MVVAWALSLSVVLLAGCGATPGAAADPQAVGPRLRALRATEEDPAARSRRGVEAPPPAGLESLASLGDDNGDPEAIDRRHRSLPELLPILAAPIPDPFEPDLVATPAQRAEAIRRYASGRERLLRRDIAGALTDLRAAAALDGASGEVWLALGDAQAAAGAVAESTVSMERAASLGAGGARPWEVLGRTALAAGDNARAAGILAAAVQVRSGANGSDPALQSLIGIELGQALDGLGYSRAAAQSLETSLRLLDMVQGTQRFRAELGAMIRRRGDLWFRVGDLACRAGDFARASAAYETAASLPAFGSGMDRLLDRRVYAVIREGRPGAAANMMFDSIAAEEGWVGDGSIGMCRYIRRWGGPKVPGVLRASLEELATQPFVADSDSVGSRLSLAMAALAEGDQSASILRARLRLRPQDDQAAAALIWLARSRGVAEAAGIGASLTAAAPLRAETYARILLAVAPLDGIMASLPSERKSPAADLLSARLLGQLEMTDAALDRLDAALSGSSEGSMVRLGVQLAIAEIAAAGGRWDRVDGALDSLGPDWPTVDEASLFWARAGALSASQRFNQAFEVLRHMAEAPAPETPPDVRIEHMMAAAEMAARSGQPADAERWLLAALEIDHRHEGVMGRLLGLYSPSGARPDQTRFADTIRRLRQGCPDGRVVRNLRAQEMLRRGPVEDTYDAVLEIVRESPTESTSLDMLAEAADRLPALSAKQAEAESILQERIERAPDDETAMLALARLLTGSGRVEEAESLLRAWAEVHGTTEAGRTLERILRQSPAGADEADQLALSRLGAVNLDAPRSITASIELAELLQHLGRTEEAIAAMESATPDPALLTAGQAAVVVGMATRASGGRGNTASPMALAAMRLAVDHGVRLPEDLHGRRLVLLLGEPATSVGDLYAAADRMASDYPSQGVAPFLFVARNLGALEASAADSRSLTGARALAFAELAAVGHPEPPMLAEWLLEIGRLGTAEDARRMIRLSLDRGAEGEVIRVLSPTEADPGTPSPPPPTGSAGASQMALLAGDFAAVLGRDEAAADFYRLSLSLDPEQPWAANNLGYHLAETARRPDGEIDLAALEESERLLTIAAAALPEDGSVLDSLGWVRYRRGILTDERDEFGAVVVEGAVTLLARAARTSKGEDNQTILDHLGDALWLAGERDTAAGAWALAEQSARRRLEILRSSPAPRQAVEEVGETLSRVSAKLAAVRSRMTPAVGWTIPIR